MFWNPVERGGAFVARALLLGVFDLLPVGPDFVHVLDLGVTEDVRMAADEFVHEMPRDLFEIKRAPFLRHLAMENDLQQQIA